MKNKSFTLIELLVVIVIIGILAGVIIVSTSSSIGKASIAKVKVFENSVQNELGANMVSRWKLDEISGGVTPDAWGNNPGTIYGDPTVKDDVDCVSGKCMEFDGVDDYIVCGNTPQLTKDITISLWAKVNQAPVEYSTVFFSLTTPAGKYNGTAWFEYRSSKAINAYFRDSTPNDQIPSSALEVKKWYYLVSMHDYTNQKSYLYINANKPIIDSEPAVGQLMSNGSQTLIGSGREIAYGSDFNGLIDDVRIYNAALTTSQIKQEYIAGLNSLLANNNISKEEYDERINSLALNND